MNRQLPADLQFLLNWKHSVFWAFAGILSVATCVSSTNRRLEAEAERVQLQQHKVEMLEHVLRLEGQAKQQAKQLAQVEDLLTNSAGQGWFGRAQLPARDLLLVLTDKKAPSG